MKISAFKVNQYSENWKQFKIFVSSISIFDLKDYVYVKTVKDYLSQTDEEKVLNDIFGKNWTDEFMSIESMQIDSEWKTKKVKETQRELNEKKLKSISNYINKEKWVFPTSILLWSKIKDFIDVKENNWIDILEINESYKWKEGFFIIDWQHRVFWILNYIYNKLLIDFNKEKGIIEKVKYDNNFEPVVNYINHIISEVSNEENWAEKINKFIEDNKFDLPVVIIIELSVDNMALLFADINANATKLDSNLETWIYWNKDINKKERKIFVQIWEKLNSNPNSPLVWRFKMPTNFEKNNLSKIWIKPFCDNSLKLILINGSKKNIEYNKKPFNLLYDELTKYESTISDESVEFMTNGLLVIYFVVFHNAKLLFWVNNWKSEKHWFINTNNLGLYLYIIKYITLKLYSSNKSNYLELFYKNETIELINKIFEERIWESLKATYETYKYFEKWKMWWSWWAKEAEIVKYFKRKLYNIDESINWRDFNKFLLEKENDILNEK